jgi:hypothetical protein
MSTAFTGGIRRPQVQSNQSNDNNQQQSQYDRLVTVLGYNTDARTLACEDEKGKKFEVFVNPEEYARGEKAAAVMPGLDRAKTWMGHSIDKQMEKNYGVGSKVILQRSRVHKKDNGQGMAVTEVQRVIGVPNAEPDKTFQGIFTLTSRTDENRLKRIARVQHWQNKGIDINDGDALEALKQQMDEAAARNGEKIGEYPVTRPTIGVQFRALMKTDRISEYDKSPIYEAVDTSIPFDWMPGPLDEAGKEIKSQAHPITGDEMLAFVDQYADYIMNHAQFKDAAEAGEMQVEVCAYKSYPASNNKQLQLTFGEPNRDQHAEKNPLYQLSHRKSFVDMAQTEQIQGRNYAVNGIIQISPNKLEKVNGKPEEIASYWVNNLHANHTKGHVMAMVRTSQGYKVEPHANLKLIVEKRAENDAAAAPAPAPQKPSYNSAPAAAPAPAPAAEPVRHTPQPQADLDDDFDPFATPEASAPSAPARVARFGKK